MKSHKSFFLLALFAATLLCAGFFPLVVSAQAQRQERIVVDGSTTVGPIAKAFAEYYMSNHPGVSISVSESGSGNGAKSLLNGSCDVAAMSRFMKNTEFKACVDKEVFPVAHVVAMDGLPILVHPANPVRNLTLEQVRDIYAGRITNWKEVGGPDLRIVKVSRDTNSGTYETFSQIVMQEEKPAADTEYVGSNGAIRDRIQKTPSAIGYAGLGFVDRTVKALEINGVAPDRQTVATGRYPVSRPLYFFTNHYPELGSHLHAFATLYLTQQGQDIIEGIGFVPVTHY